MPPPIPAPPPDASATQRGLVNLVGQVFAGLKTFQDGVGTGTFYDLASDPSAPLSASGHVRLRSNAGALQVSEGGASYHGVVGYTGGPSQNHLAIFSGATTVSDNGGSGGPFYVSGYGIGFGAPPPNANMGVYAEVGSSGGWPSVAQSTFRTSPDHVTSAGTRGGVLLGGVYSSANALTDFGGVLSEKANGTDGDPGGKLSLWSRTSAGTLTRATTITEDQLFLVGATADDGSGALIQAAGYIKSTTGGFILTDGTIVATAADLGGNISLAAVGSSPNSDGASFSSGTLTLQPADGTNPGVLTAGTQTIGGAKTFSAGITLGVALPIADGGTGQTSRAAALGALLPSDSGAGGEFLTTDGAGNFTWSVAAGTGISALTGDVTAAGTGSVAATVAFVGGSSASNVHSAELLANASTSSATASTILRRDSSANARLNNLVEGYTTTSTAAGTTTLAVGDTFVQRFTGTTTQNVVLPDATTLVVGHAFYVINRSTGVVTVKDNGGSTVLAVPAGAAILFTCTSVSSSAGGWDAGGLQAPTTSSLGGVNSKASTTHQFLTQIGTDGSVSAAQPAFSDISGTVAASQLPNPSSSTLGGVQSFASVSHQFLTQISTSGVVSAAQPASGDLSDWPSITGNNGKFLTLSSGSLAWATAGGVSGLTAGRVPYASNSTTLTDTAEMAWDSTHRQFALVSTSNDRDILVLSAAAYRDAGMVTGEGNEFGIIDGVTAYNGSPLPQAGFITGGNIAPGSAAYFGGMTWQKANNSSGDNSATCILTTHPSSSGATTAIAQTWDASQNTYFAEGKKIGLNGSGLTSYISGESSAHGVTLGSNVTSSSSNVAYLFDTQNTLSAGYLWQFNNHGTFKCYCDYQGSIYTVNFFDSTVAAGSVAYGLTEGALYALDGTTGNSFIKNNATSHGIELQSNTTNSGSNAGYVLDTKNTLTGSTVLLNLKNGGTSKWKLGLSALTFPDSTTQSTAAVGAGASYGTYSGRPSAGTSGRIYVASDAPCAMWADDGSNWHPLVCGQIVGTQPKAASNFTEFHQATHTTPTLADRNGALHIAIGSDSLGSPYLTGFQESLSSSTMHVEGAFTMNTLRALAQANSYWSAGFVMRESGTGKLASIEIYVNDTVTNSTSYAIGCSYWASPISRTSFSGFALPYTIGPVFLRLRRSGSNIVYEFSTDAQNWVSLTSIATTTIFTTAPDQVGIGVTTSIATDTMDADVLSYNSGS